MPKQWAALVRACDATEYALPTAEEWWTLKRAGSSTREALVALGYDPVSAARLAERWQACVETPELARLDRPFAGLREAFAIYSARGIKFAVLSARNQPDRLKAQIAASSVGAFIGDTVVVSPDAAVVQKARELRRLDPDGFIGDTEADAQSATVAGIPFVGVTCGQRSASYMREHGVACLAENTVDALARIMAQCID